jgi:hypothetical protein
LGRGKKVAFVGEIICMVVTDFDSWFLIPLRSVVC